MGELGAEGDAEFGVDVWQVGLHGPGETKSLVAMSIAR